MSDPISNPREFVLAGWNWLRPMADEWVYKVEQSIDALTFIDSAPVISFEVPPQLQVDYGTFLRPERPDAPTVPAIAVDLPDAPAQATITVADGEAAPSEPNFAGMVFAKPSAPTRAAPQRPDDTDVVLTDITVPDAPDYVLPTEPTLYALDLPAVPDLTLPTFDGVRPTTVLDTPQNQFAWQRAEYDMALVDTIKGQVSSMAINGLALPVDVERAIFDRARGREDALTLQATQEAADELATRGLRQPGGLFSRTMERIRAQARQRTSGASSDLAIAIAKENVEAVRFAIAQAISLEVALIQANIAENGQQLEAAKAGQQVLIDLFNARVALHNAQWEGYKADAAVFESRIRAIQAEADIYKAQIDAQKAVGDVNESLVRAYGERMRALSVLSEFYRNNIDAARAKGELNTQKLEQVRLRLQTWETDLSGWGREWDAAGKALELELGSARFHESLGNVYGRRVDAWRTKRGVDFDAARIEIEVENQRLERYRALLTGAQVDSQTQLAAVDAVLRKYATEAPCSPQTRRYRPPSRPRTIAPPRCGWNRRDWTWTPRSRTTKSAPTTP
jgi:hypothetical protein